MALGLHMLQYGATRNRVFFMIFNTLKRYLVGVPLTTDRVAHERLTKKKALAVFSSDALSSVAYATEAILVILVGASSPGNSLPWTWAITLTIVALLAILILSYRQTIGAYPTGGGAYTVCKENLGEHVGLMAAASLVIDYILTVAVSIAAGTAAVTSAFPHLLPHRVLISNVAILLLLIMNLRGIRESGSILSIPTYIFIFAMFSLFGGLAYHAILYPMHVESHLMPSTTSGVGIWLILVAFANGCTALSGVEAISNGVTAFQQPEQKNAQTTLVWMGVILAALFLGVSYFAHVYGVLPKPDDTVISQMARLLNNKPFYFLVQAATAGILFLAANTSFNDFPRVASLLAEDRYLPRQLASRGDRLVFSNGIMGLGLLSMFLIWAFNSEVDLLLPMYAIGVFLSFSLSQAGMVKHWFEFQGAGWRSRAFVNGLGCVVTSIALTVIVITKFPQGGWIVCALIPLFVMQFRRIRYHYLLVGNQLRLVGPAPAIPAVANHYVIIPVSGIHRGVIEALNYARSISKNIVSCYIDISPRTTSRIVGEWNRYGMGVDLKILPSPYRSVVRPFLNFVEEMSVQHPESMITVIIPEFVTAKWWQNLLHNQTAIIIKTALAFKRRVVVTTVRYHLTR
jgi:amino acid transporter